MNINGLKNNISMWKPISEFPSYKELVELSLKYYNRCLKYCFSGKDKELYIIEFTYKSDKSFDIKYGYFSDILKDAYPPHLEFKAYFDNIRKYNFNKNLKELFNLYKKYENELVYYTHISNLYDLIKNSI
jgi:hypothetical protein